LTIAEGHADVFLRPGPPLRTTDQIFLFANTSLGAQASEAIYGLIETAKGTSLDPFRYLIWILKTAHALDQAADA